MSVTSNLGKVMLTPRGTYSPTNAYEPLDIVVYSGSSYLVLQSVAGVTPSNDGSYYMLLASRGLQGQTGQSATVQIGTVTTVPYGTGSSVTNVGTQNNAVLNIELEQGPAGSVSSVDGVTATDGNVALGAITYNAQTLSDAQKQQAVANIGAESMRLQFTNTGIAASAFVSDATYEDFPYRAAVALSGVTANMTPEVVFNVADATSGIYAPVAACYAGGIYLYASEVPSATVTIPTITCWKAVG